MPRFTHKIEDLLETVAGSVRYTGEPATGTDLNPTEKANLSFPRILDFSFPDNAPDSRVAQIGEVVYVGDGVIHIVGLDNAKIDDILEIQTENTIEKALILGVYESHTEAVVLGNYIHIKRGQPAKATGGKLKFPVGQNLLGRVINPLGIPLDGQGPIVADHHREVEFSAPGVVDRTPISVPLHTGIVSIDSTIPIGRGQRELVIGDRKTGKTRTMLDIICNQRQHQVYCVYVGIGIQSAKAKATFKLLQERGASEYTSMVIATSDDPPSLQYIAPYAGTALAEYFMYSGRHALIIYDDLSKQAKAYRQVSLLLKRSPGRDAYPGDIFFLHSRLLERSSYLHPHLGGGSLTALPIAETQVGDISDYIITNLMSITDGHIFLDANMMHEGIMPAINSGTSVSRIGGKVQLPLLRKVGELAGRILARYEEVKSFETINTEVSVETVRDIKRGRRLRELFSQDTNLNMNVDEEIIFLGIATSSRLDHFNPSQVLTFKELFVSFYRQDYQSDHQHEIIGAEKLEHVDRLFDIIFTRFCLAHHLPTMPNTAVT